MSDESSLAEELLEGWRTSYRINLKLIDTISDEGAASTSVAAPAIRAQSARN